MFLWFLKSRPRFVVEEAAQRPVSKSAQKNCSLCVLCGTVHILENSATIFHASSTVFPEVHLFMCKLAVPLGLLRARGEVFGGGLVVA